MLLISFLKGYEKDVLEKLRTLKQPISIEERLFDFDFFFLMIMSLLPILCLLTKKFYYLSICSVQRVLLVTKKSVILQNCLLTKNTIFNFK